MIQRIQSVYLLATVAFYVLHAVVLLQRVQDHGGHMQYLGIAASVLGILSLISIFLYADRKRQQRVVGLTRLAGALYVLFMVVTLYWQETFQTLAASSVLDLLGILGAPIVALVCLHLAHGGIRRDIDLVRSMDRIR